MNATIEKLENEYDKFNTKFGQDPNLIVCGSYSFAQIGVTRFRNANVKLHKWLKDNEVIMMIS